MFLKSIAFFSADLNCNFFLCNPYDNDGNFFPLPNCPIAELKKNVFPKAVDRLKNSIVITWKENIDNYF